MIKRLTFVRRAAGLESAGFDARWAATARRSYHAAPADARPVRLAHCVLRPGRSALPYDGVAFAWFADGKAAAEHDRWASDAQTTAGVLDPASSIVGVEERVAAGSAWLDARWRGEPTGSHPVLLGLIARAPQLSRLEFREYWWEHHRPLADATVPAELQPVAYVHDYVLPEDDFAWDGIGELFDTTLAVAARRGAWFAGEAAVSLVADEVRFMVSASRHVVVADHDVLVANSFWVSDRGTKPQTPVSVGQLVNSCDSASGT